MKAPANPERPNTLVEGIFLDHTGIPRIILRYIPYLRGVGLFGGEGCGNKRAL